MRISKVIKYSLVLLGLSGVIGGFEIRSTPEELRKWILEMHKAQIKLLKMDWGNPGFCTVWDKKYRG